MDSIKIVSGQKRIAINDDPERVIVFNPSDVVFAEKFYRLLGNFQQKLTDYEKRAESVDAVKDVDDSGVPVNLEERIGLLREVCEYMGGQVDYLFGPGTAQKITDGVIDIDIYEQFFTGITPFIQRARQDKIQRYAGKRRK